MVCTCSWSLNPSSGSPNGVTRHEERQNPHFLLPLIERQHILPRRNLSSGPRPVLVQEPRKSSPKVHISAKTPSGLSHLQGWYGHNASLCMIEYQHNGCTACLLRVVENQARYLIALDSSSALNPWAYGHHLGHESSPLVASEKSQSFPPSPVLPSLSVSSTSPH